MSTTRGQQLIGKVLGGCILEKLLGYGGSSAVFLAQQHSPERKVAVKVFLPRSTMDAQMQRDFYERFLREAEATSRLVHPNILSIYSYGEQDGWPYIVMPYMEGGTLKEYLSQRGPLSLSEALWYLEQIASALDYAHQLGWVHCDVKPANILLDSEGIVALSDFGIAHLRQADAVTGQQIKKSPDVLMGTPDYVSPEQALGQPLDGRSDVYSLGVTLFYLLAGQLPFEAESTIAMALLHVHENPPALSLMRANITPTIDRVLHKALAKSADQRFQTAGEFSAAFAEAITLAAEERPSDAADKGSHPLVLAAKIFQNDPQRPVVAVKPINQVKLLERGFLNVPRVIIAVLLLVSITFGAAMVTALITLHLTKGPQAPAPIIPPVTADSLSDNNDWPIDTTNNTFFFTGQQYHVLNNSERDVAVALYANHTYTNFRLAVTMAEIHSLPDEANFYGVIFRSTPDQSHYYVFEVSLAEGGEFYFLRNDGDDHWKTLGSGPAPSLHTDSGESNTVTVEARGNSFTFFINDASLGQPIPDQTESALTSGAIGLYVEEQGTEVAFSHLYIKPLK